MLDDDNTGTTESTPSDPVPTESAAVETDAAPAKKTAARKTTARKTAAKKAPAKRAAAKKTAAAGPADEPAVEPVAGDAPTSDEAPPAEAAPAKKTAARKTTARKTAAKKAPAKRTAAKKVAAQEVLPLDETTDAPATDTTAEAEAESPAPATALLFQAPEPTKAPVRRTRRTKVVSVEAESAAPEDTEPEATASPAVEDAAPESAAAEEKPKPKKKSGGKAKKATAPEAADAQTAKADDAKVDEAQTDDAPAEDEKSGAEKSDKPAKKGGNKGKGGKGKGAKAKAEELEEEADEAASDDAAPDESIDGTDGTDADDEAGETSGGPRRRRRRGGRRRRKAGDGPDSAGEGNEQNADTDEDDSADDDETGENGAGGTRRRRRRRRAGDSGGGASDDPENTVTRVRQSRSAEDQITAVAGSTRLEAKKQRRREGREAGRRRAPIVSEAEFLARRESVERNMVIRQRPDLTQIAVLEDKVLVEHYVARESQTSLIGNVYVGRVQNVLPSMEAAFVDIGKGRNAVIYAGEINWAALGHKDGQPRKIESVLTSGQSILVQVTKDPIGHKGARLTGQVSLAGRFLVYVPDGTTSGISRKLPDTERSRLKTLLKEIVPDTAGVIVRTAAEGASEEELTQDVERLKARWDEIESKAKSGNSPKLLYGEPDLTLKVVRDLFTEDFAKLVIEGEDAWNTVQGYVAEVAPDLQDRLERFESPNGKDSFATYRIDEQIAKGLDRKVWLPSGGSLIIDRTEAMTVVDVNTGKFTGSGGNLEETVTKNNLEAAEEIVRQLRLRDIGGIIVVDFIDMVLESNRDLVLRRLVECLGRDRTRHQVAEVTSLGLVQMTRKRIGTGLLEAFSEDCEHCQGRGIMVHDMPVEQKNTDDGARSGGRRGRGRKGDDSGNQGNQGSGNGNQRGNDSRATPPAPPSPKDVAAVARPENADRSPVDASDEATGDAEPTVDTTSEAPAEAPAPTTTTTTRTRGSRNANRRRTTRSADTSDTADAAADRAADDADAQGGSSTQNQARGEQSAPVEAEKPVAVAPVETDKPVEAEKHVEAAPVEAPKVVTRTRRRASRPSGVHTTPVVEALTVTAPPAAPEVSDAAPVEAPKVVTRTRGRRGASRASGAGSTAAPETAEAGAPASEGGADLHVPVKNKGGRKH
ncbi:Rne/Rng family ribonuclease [Nocardioides sp. Soil796]|uniref:Rne/Rng family ribonuclease n=1 Tax=Nocardioides sp. Soil796 TaxID=1736412 RepID=UPI0009EC9739|nr:Rne/Rng family ribonuclease [Nocardioides sp. Soil796]